MNVMRRFGPHFFTVFCLFILSCQRPDDTGVKLADLTDGQIIDLIKINFLEEYGGVESERISICNQTATHSSECNLTTTLNYTLADAANQYSLQKQGAFTIQCQEKINTYNNRYIQFKDEASSGTSILGKIDQSFSMESVIKISGNVSDNRYVTSLTSNRTIEYLSGPFKNLYSFIRFQSNLCGYDVESCALSSLSEYTVNFSISHSNSGEQQMQMSGTIKKDNDKWLFSSQDGLTAEWQ